jgi:hypothetical protein
MNIGMPGAVREGWEDLYKGRNSVCEDQERARIA